MKIIFEEIRKGNLPKEGEKEEFVIKEDKREKCFYLYHLGNPSPDQILKFNLMEANTQEFENRIKKIFFKGFKYLLNEETKKWEKIKWENRKK